MITFIVKGDAYQVQAAAELHCVDLVTIKTHSRFSECVCQAPSDDRDRVVAWFCESNHIEAPFPPGAVTWYGDKSV